MVASGEPARQRLRDVLSVSGDVPAFDDRLLGALRWASARYVAPLSALLSKASPPNVPRRATVGGYPPVQRPPDSEMGGLGEAGRGSRSVVFVGRLPEAALTALASQQAAGNRTVVVVAPTTREAAEAAAMLTGHLGERVVVGGSHLSGAAATQSWVAAATRPGTVLVGTREVAAWPLAAAGMAVVLGEGRRGMKDKATPTVHARDLLAKRAATERFAVVLADLVPTAEALSRAAAVVSAGTRTWGLVEVVDRRADAQGVGLLADRTTAALRAAMAEGRRVFVFTDRRVTTMRCVRCRAIRRCVACGAAPGGGNECRRCGAPIGGCAECDGRRFEALGAGMARVTAEVGRIVGAGAVGEVGSGRPVEVGTERDLPGLKTDLTIVIDADGPLMAPTYRAAEDALRLIARAVAAAGVGRGRRALIQTSAPDHAMFAALRKGDPVPFVREESERRAALGFPPGGEILVVEATGAPDRGTDLAAEIGHRASVLGPAELGDSLRWLIQGRDLTATRVVLRAVVGRWRESGARVRVDADPIDL